MRGKGKMWVDNYVRRLLDQVKTVAKTALTSGYLEKFLPMYDMLLNYKTPGVALEEAAKYADKDSTSTDWLQSDGELHEAHDDSPSSLKQQMRQQETTHAATKHYEIGKDDDDDASETTSRSSGSTSEGEDEEHPATDDDGTATKYYTMSDDDDASETTARSSGSTSDGEDEEDPFEMFERRQKEESQQ
jgi:hypothetical protein